MKQSMPKHLGQVSSIYWITIGVSYTTSLLALYCIKIYLLTLGNSSNISLRLSVLVVSFNNFPTLIEEGVLGILPLLGLGMGWTLKSPSSYTLHSLFGVGAFG